jgi:hypothetical protein
VGVAQVYIYLSRCRCRYCRRRRRLQQRRTAGLLTRASRDPRYSRLIWLRGLRPSFMPIALSTQVMRVQRQTPNTKHCFQFPNIQHPTSKLGDSNIQHPTSNMGDGGARAGEPTTTTATSN